MKVIFLDFQGVLFTPACEVTARLENRPLSAWEPAVEALNLITGATGAKIVVTAPWRSSGVEQMRRVTKQWGATGEVVDIVPDASDRHSEIMRWFCLAATPESYEHGLGQVRSFAILDAGNVYPPLSEYLFRTDEIRGLTEEIAVRVISSMERGGPMLPYFSPSFREVPRRWLKNK